MNEPDEPNELNELRYSQATVEKFCRDFACSEQEALETLAWCDEHGAMMREIKGLNPARRLEGMVAIGLIALVQFQQRQKNWKILRGTTRVYALVMGYRAPAGADSIAKIARECGCSKQVLSQCADAIEARVMELKTQT